MQQLRLTAPKMLTAQYAKTVEQVQWTMRLNCER